MNSHICLSSECNTLCGQFLSGVPLFCDPMDCSAPVSSVHGISQAISFSRGSSQPSDWTCISRIGRWILYHQATREVFVNTLKSNFIDSYKKFKSTDILKFINWTHTEYLYLGSYILAQANEPWAEELCVPSEQKHFISCFVYSMLVTMEVWNVFGTARIVKTPSSAWVPMGLGGADPPTNRSALEAWMRNNPLLHQTTGNKNCTNPWPSNLASGYPSWLYNNDQIN